MCYKMIKVKNISKIYKLYTDPKDRMKEALHPFRKKYHTDFYALKDISFNVKKGETIGIIGKNGAGKSTLLKILTGVLTPSSGNYEVKGKIASLLELGAGFNPELSGMENIYFNGSIIGYTKEDMDKKLQDILDFADIGEFIHQPVKTYSSGMYVRLAFAIAINVDPEVLIVDEALSVGDMRFQLKCFRKLEEIKNNGTTILFVTHDTGAVINHCDKAIWLHDGKVKELGKPESVCKHYMSFMAYGEETEVKSASETSSPSDEGEMSIGQRGLGEVEKNNKIPWQSVAGCESFGEGGAEITDVAFYDAETGKSLEMVEGGEEVCFSIKGVSNSDIPGFIFGFMINDSQGNHVAGMNTLAMNKNININNEKFLATFSFIFPKFCNGNYMFMTSVAEGTQSNHIQLHWIHDALEFKVFSQRKLAELDILLEMDNVYFRLDEK